MAQSRPRTLKKSRFGLEVRGWRDPHSVQIASIIPCTAGHQEGERSVQPSGFQ